MSAVAPDVAALWPQPLPDPETVGFWESTAAGVLAVCRCAECRTWMHPPLERCRSCAGPVSFEPVSGRARLHSWIRVDRQSVPGPAAPYLIGVAELAEDPAVRLTGVLRVGGEPRIGVDVTVTLEPVPGGEFVAPVIELR